MINSRKTILPNLLIVIAVSLMLRATSGYRPYPSIDDFAYIPQTIAKLDHQLFRSDFLIQNTSLHLPAYPLLLYIFNHSIGAPLGFWFLTIILSFLTVGACWCLFKAVGGSMALFPIASLLALAPRLPGLGRGLYDGAFGDAFHLQWLALCILLWAFLSWIKQRTISAGLILGACIWAHPVVGVHGAFCLAVSVIATSSKKVKDLFLLTVVSGIVSAPVVLTRIGSLVAQSTSPYSSSGDLIKQGYLFRTPHEFTLEAIPLPFLLLFALLGLAGFGGALTLDRLRKPFALKAMTGILLGESLLLASAIIMQSGLIPTSWEESLLPLYLLHLTRSSPLFVAIASVLAVAGLEAILGEDSNKRQFGGEAFWLLGLCFLVSMMLLVLTFINWDLGRLALGLLGLLYFLENQRKGHSFVATFAAIILSVGAALMIGISDEIKAPVPQEEKELYEWVHSKTDRDALFIIPVGFQQFRFYALRSVYVDFKLFPASTPALIPEWRKRLELVAAPDKRALKFSGWEAVPQLDRTYAQRNTPERIIWLLRQTGAKYFVWDSSALSVPPFLNLRRPTAEGLVHIFGNTRFSVYRLAEPIG